MDELAARRRGRHVQDSVIAEVLGHGATHKEAARRAGVSIRTVSRRLADPDFCAEVEEVRTRSLEGIATELMTGARRAVVRLTRQVDDDSLPPTVQLGAAKALISAALQYRDAGTYEAKIKEIEAVLYGTGSGAESGS